MAQRPSQRSRRPAWHWVLGLAVVAALGAVAALGYWHRAPPPRPAPPQAAAQGVPAPPPGFRVITLAGGPANVVDGDTFDADLDGDGGLSLPRERVRLLYVDTPELGPSWKGQDKPYGEPARDFLALLLQRRPIVLWVPRDLPAGKYGRTLALVWAGGENVSLALIRAGHSYFDNRFQTPADYAVYARAEGDAFDARRGIWDTAASRKRYLTRLAREDKTPAGARNPRYVAALQRAETFRPQALIGKYIHLEGTVTAVRTLSKSVREVRLARGSGQKDLRMVAWRRVAARMGVDGWAPGTRVRVEGFVHVYRGAPELVLHYGGPLP